MNDEHTRRTSWDFTVILEVAIKGHFLVVDDKVQVRKPIGITLTGRPL